MSGFAADWLSRREPFDAAARAADLGRRFAAAVRRSGQGPRRLIDLAAGTGSNFRMLAPLIGADQDWLLVDHDPLLMMAQKQAIMTWAEGRGLHCRDVDGGVAVKAGAATWTARAQRLDLASSLEQLDFAAFDGVTTTAFLDLVSGDWLDRLGGALTGARVPLLATLTVDGRREWHPFLPTDARVLEAFQGHQAGDKGFGAALGSAATAYLAGRLAGSRYEVDMSRSDWRIGPQHTEMLTQMAQESAAVAAQAEPSAAVAFAEWLTLRREQIHAARVSLEIGHLDLLAIPLG